MSGKYDDIIDLPHHVSKKHSKMSMQNRAAQFSPFAALTGHDAAIKETARLTNKRIELSESVIAEIDLKLQELNKSASGHPEIALTYFKPDNKKAGGKYVRVTDKLKRIDGVKRRILLLNGEEIPIDDILGIE